MKNIIVYKESSWEYESSKLIKSFINNSKKKTHFNLMLTGGRTAKKVYQKIDKSFWIDKKINILLSDERKYSIKNSKSNYYNIRKNLFNNDIPKNINLFSFFEKYNQIENDLKKYDKKLQKKIDLLVLTLGDDGHVASLFPNDRKILDGKKNLIVTREPNKNLIRYSISKKIIANSKNILVLVTGKMKGKVFNQINQSKDILEIPARLINNGYWLLDTVAKNECI